MIRDPNTHVSIRHANRRQFLWHFGGGLGGIALASLLDVEGLLAAPHFAPKAKRVVQLFMSGAACPTGSAIAQRFSPLIPQRHLMGLAVLRNRDCRTGRQSNRMTSKGEMS